MTGAEAWIMDTETTGSNEPQVIELAMIGLKGATIDPSLPLLGDNIYERFRPSKPIELGALAVHHIMDEDLTDCRLHTDLSLPAEMRYAIGHNVDYDWNAVGAPAHVKRIDTCAIARHLLPDLDSYSQSALIYHFYRQEARDWLKNAHCAYDDVENCHRLLVKLLELVPEGVTTWEDLWLLSEEGRIPKKIWFGKHKGTPIAELDKGYCQWYLKQAETDEYLCIAMRRRLAM